MVKTSGRTAVIWFLAGFLAASLLWALPLWGAISTAGDAQATTQALRTNVAEDLERARISLGNGERMAATLHVGDARDLVAVVPGLADRPTREALAIVEQALARLALPHAWANLTSAEQATFVEGWMDALRDIQRLLAGEHIGRFDTATFVAELDRLLAEQDAAIDGG